VTAVAWLLLLLAVATALGCVAFALPPRNLKPHPFVTDPVDLAEGERIGRREKLDEGETRRLGPSRLRSGYGLAILDPQQRSRRRGRS
jgi:hypothetical protein